MSHRNNVYRTHFIKPLVLSALVSIFVASGCISINKSRLRVGVFYDDKQSTNTVIRVKQEGTYGVVIRWAAD